MFKSDINKFDIRLINRMLNSGELSPEAYQDYLKNLEDSGEYAEQVDTSFGEAGAPDASMEKDS